MTRNRERYRVSHVFLDVDGTLLDINGAVAAALSAAAVRASEFAGEEITPRALEQTRRAVMAEPAFRVESPAVQFREAVTRVLSPHGVSLEECVNAVTDLTDRTYEDTLCAYPDVHEALQALVDMGLTLIAASNANADFDQVGLSRYLSDTHLGPLIGVSKPQPRFFELALERFSVAPSDALMVGDRLDNDVRPAQAVGMHGVLLDRTSAVHDEDIHRIAALNELPGLIERA
ncbi:MAG: HAD family hydrolase [Chloroflexota bacterium]